MTAGTGTPTDIQAQRDAIPPLKVNKLNLLSDALKGMVQGLAKRRQLLCQGTLCRTRYENFTTVSSL